ncbi:MAG: hypothetical protein IJN23_02515 [Akkermansia sp.]|nr:hypothetical protein [Akkermansia sp.]
MKRVLSLLLSLTLYSCTQNQLILDPFDEGESLMIEDEEAILQFEQMMADIPTPENVYKPRTRDRNFFDSADVISTFQDTQPTIGICRSGEKEYYYHIERDLDGVLISDMDQGVTDYIISPEKFEEIRNFIRLHTPVKPEYEPEDEETTEDEEDE